MDTGPVLCSSDPSSLIPAHPVHGSAPWEALLQRPTTEAHWTCLSQKPEPTQAQAMRLKERRTALQSPLYEGTSSPRLVEGGACGNHLTLNSG